MPCGAHKFPKAHCVTLHRALKAVTFHSIRVHKSLIFDRFLKSNRAVSKTVYKELRNRVITVPSAEEKYRKFFINNTLDWPEIYSFPYRVTSDIKTREFQFKLLNKYLATNAFLNKIGVVSSSVCSFCEKENESLEHIFIHCNYTE